MYISIYITPMNKNYVLQCGAISCFDTYFRYRVGVWSAYVVCICHIGKTKSRNS